MGVGIWYEQTKYCVPAVLFRCSTGKSDTAQLYTWVHACELMAGVSEKMVHFTDDGSQRTDHFCIISTTMSEAEVFACQFNLKFLRYLCISENKVGNVKRQSLIRKLVESMILNKFLEDSNLQNYVVTELRFFNSVVYEIYMLCRFISILWGKKLTCHYFYPQSPCFSWPKMSFRWKFF